MPNIHYLHQKQGTLKSNSNISNFHSYNSVAFRTQRLRSFAVQAGTSEPTQYAQYLYDAGGTRVKKLVRTAGGDYTSRVYIDDVFEYLTDGTDEQNLLHVMDDQTRVAMVRLGNDFGDSTPAIKYNLDDYLGNSTVLLETSGANINKEEYYPFGETSFGSYGKKRYKFSGKERDEESGLYYCRFRYHSAWTCRFISVDPLAPKYPHYCSYSYAGNKVISAVEFEGLEDVTVQNKVGNAESIDAGRTYELNGLKSDVIQVDHWEDGTGKFLSTTFYENIGGEKGDKIVSYSNKDHISADHLNLMISLPVAPEGTEIYPSIDSVVENFLFDYGPAYPHNSGTKAESNEHMINIFRVRGGYAAGNVVVGAVDYADFTASRLGEISSIFVVANAHTHVIDGRGHFSHDSMLGSDSPEDAMKTYFEGMETSSIYEPADLNVSQYFGIPIYMGDAYGNLHYYNPKIMKRDDIYGKVTEYYDQSYSINTFVPPTTHNFGQGQ